MVQHWIDINAGIAYISVGAQLTTFREFLDAIERLISHPARRPGMPVVGDVRQCRWVPPVTAIDEWREYLPNGNNWCRAAAGRWSRANTAVRSSRRYCAPLPKMPPRSV